jgi:hypothetical protein
MALLVPNVGEGRSLAAILNKTAPENLLLKLYKSNTTPAEGDTHLTYTEADFTGYAAKTLTDDWRRIGPVTQPFTRKQEGSAAKAEPRGEMCADH